MPKFEVVDVVEGNKREQKLIKVWVEQLGHGSFRVMYRKGDIVDSLVYADTSSDRLVTYADDSAQIGLEPVII